MAQVNLKMMQSQGQNTTAMQAVDGSTGLLGHHAPHPHHSEIVAGPAVMHDVGLSAKIVEKKKRLRDPENWKRNKAKKALYSPKCEPKVPNCKHGDKSKTFKCNLLTEEDVRHFHRMFYDNHSKLEQDTFILLYSYSNLVNRKRPKDNSRSSRTVSTTYHIRKANNRVVQVCKLAFENIICVSKSRVSNVVKRHFVSGELPRETRGGSRQNEKYESLRKSVRGFIDRFPVTVVNNEKGQPKHVLAGDLNVQKMLKLYNDEVPENLRVKKDFFYKIFNGEYNIAFANPKEKSPVPPPPAAPVACPSYQHPPY
ncbi:hypothetical protein B566_EDAN004613 [Ephemera danica]|nr:hypothetical protein B566_EDAN004613 [Ephemera danica]